MRGAGRTLESILSLLISSCSLWYFNLEQVAPPPPAFNKSCLPTRLPESESCLPNVNVVFQSVQKSINLHIFCESITTYIDIFTLKLKILWFLIWDLLLQIRYKIWNEKACINVLELWIKKWSWRPCADVNLAKNKLFWRRTHRWRGLFVKI